MVGEMHVYDDHRGDVGPLWGTYDLTCPICGRAVVVVKKVDVVDPVEGICLSCLRDRSRPYRVDWEDGVMTVRYPVRTAA